MREDDNDLDLVIHQTYVPTEVGTFKVYKMLSVQATSVPGQDVTYYFGQKTGIGMNQDQDFFCSCPGFMYRKTCKHIDSLKTQSTS